MVRDDKSIFFDWFERLAFDHFRNSEEVFVRIRGVSHRFIVRQRFAQSFQNIFATRVRKPVAALLALIDSVLTGNLRHRWHLLSVQFIESLNVIKDGVEVPEHSSAFLIREIEIREFRNVSNVFVCNFHLMEASAHVLQVLL